MHFACKHSGYRSKVQVVITLGVRLYSGTGDSGAKFTATTKCPSQCLRTNFKFYSGEQNTYNLI